MVQIILDTNFLLVPSQFRVDIFNELERLIIGDFKLITFTNIIEELEKLSKSRKREAADAKVGLRLINTKDIKILKGIGQADDFIVDYCEVNNCIVCTNDMELKRRLKKLNIKIICLRGKTHLDWG